MRNEECSRGRLEKNSEVGISAHPAREWGGLLNDVMPSERLVTAKLKAEPEASRGIYEKWKASTGTSP